MSETKQLTQPETSSIDEQNSTTQEVPSADCTAIPTEANEPASATNESITANDDQPEQQVVDGNDTTVGVKPVQEADGDEEAQQYERFESQMIFGVDTPEAKNEALLNDLVRNSSNIKKLEQCEVDKYVSAINSTFRSTMIQGLANRAVKFNRMVLIGDASSALKAIIKSPDQGWEAFIEDQFGKDLLSTIGTYMRLAKIKGVKNHSYLGKDRILKVYSTSKKLKSLPSSSNDLIGDTLHQLKIIPINNLTDDVQIFNKRVDAAILAYKIEINRITVDHQSVIDLSSTRFNFKDSNKHVKRMCYLRDNSDDPNDACQKYLDNIRKNDGIYTGSGFIDDSGGLKGKDNFINSVKESYGSIKTSFSEGKELSAEEKSEIKTLVDYLTKLIA